jgi:hypothetical protein
MNQKFHVLKEIQYFFDNNQKLFTELFEDFKHLALNFSN